MCVMDAIDPSEIITGESPPPKQSPSRVNPWVRLAARYFDYALFFTLLRLIVGHISALPPFERWIPIEFLAWVPIEALLLWTWGTTPGKALLGTKLRKKGGNAKLSFDTALKRSFSVWVRGLGLGIPFINFICMLVAYQRLRLLRTTSWDLEGKVDVTHQAVAQWRFYLVSSLAIIGMIFYSYWKRG